MSLKEFDTLFGVKATIYEEKRKFVNRVENTVFDPFVIDNEYDKQKEIFESICYQLGENVKEVYSLFSHYRTKNRVPPLTVFSQKDFVKTQRVLVALHKALNTGFAQLVLSLQIIKALELSTLDLGVKWLDGTFYPSGDQLLDKELIEVAAGLLKPFPNEQLDLKNALENHYAKKLAGVVENCYKLMEGISRQLLGNDKTLDHNRDKLLELLNFSPHWNHILFRHVKYAHEYRHASEERHNLNPAEVEAFLYLTCLMIRALLQINKQNQFTES